MFVRRYMTSPAVTIDETATLTEAIHSLKEHKIRRLPVVRKGKLVGILSDRDIKEYCPTKATSLDIWEVHHVLAKVAVRDAMTKDPVTIRPDAPIEDAARVLHEKGIGALPVVDAKGGLAGILTEHDVFGALVALTGARRGRRPACTSRSPTARGRSGKWPTSSAPMEAGSSRSSLPTRASPTAPGSWPSAFPAARPTASSPPSAWSTRTSTRGKGDGSER